MRVLTVIVVSVIGMTGLLLWLSSCNPSPQDYARATVIAAQPGATATAAAPGIHATATAVAVEGYIKESTKDEQVAFWENIWWWGAICVCAFFVVATIVMGRFVYRTGAAAEEATKKRLDLSASVIHVDKNTKTWPILVDWERGWLLNLETGERAQIRTVSLPNPQMLAISHRVREASVYADAARDIGRSAKSAQATDLLPGVAANIPLLSNREEEG